MADETRPSEFVRRLPIGERLPLGEVADDPLFPFEGQISTRPLDPPLLNRVDLDAVGPVTTVVPIRAASAPRNFWKRTNADGH